MEQTTITIWVNPADELDFLQQLRIINDLPIENTYKWRVTDINFSRTSISNWLCFNIPIPLYLKFRTSYYQNGGAFEK